MPDSKILPKFSELEKHYPKSTAPKQFAPLGGSCEHYENQCAIRMSAALSAAGFPLGATFEKKWGNTCTVNAVRHARGAQPLADSLYVAFGPPKTLTSESSSTIDGKKGIVFFKKQEQGGTVIVSRHIDLWDGTDTKGYNPFGYGSATVWFWELPN